MKRNLKILVAGLLLMTTYAGSYVAWRGPAGLDQCDHPYQVYLPRGPVSSFYQPMIEIDRYWNALHTEINVVDY